MTENKVEEIYSLTNEVQYLLERYPQARNSDKDLLFMFLKKHMVEYNDNHADKVRITKEFIYSLPSFESITRARRKLQEVRSDLRASEIVQEVRRLHQTQMSEF